MNMAARSAIQYSTAGFKSLSSDRLDKMRRGATECAAGLHTLAGAGFNTVTAVADHTSNMVEWQHYPSADDVFDAATGYQYYYHSHPAAQRAVDEHGHFHLFGRSGYSGQRKDARQAPYTHLIGISVDAQGLPIRLFTTNRWVTDEQWLPAPRVLAMLDSFCIRRRKPSAALHRWLHGMLVLFRPQIEAVLARRDDRIMHAAQRRPLEKVLEDRRTHVVSATRISIFEQFEALDSALE